MMRLILYSKPGCHLCEGLQAKLAQVEGILFDLEIRDITTRDEWFEAYQYEIPVLCCVQRDLEVRLPRLSPRAPAKQLKTLLLRYL